MNRLIIAGLLAGGALAAAPVADADPESTLTCNSCEEVRTGSQGELRGIHGQVRTGWSVFPQTTTDPWRTGQWTGPWVDRWTARFGH
jgi:hypothetical protein